MKIRKNQIYPAVLFLIVPAVLTLASCAQVFGTSWGSALKRDPDKLIPKVTSSNVGELLEASLGDADFAITLLGKIKDSAGNAQGDEKAALQDAALKAAANGSGLTTAILNNAGTLLEGKGNTKDIQKAIDGILNDINGADLQKIADDLGDILSDDYKNKAKATDEDLAVAAVVLLLADAKNTGNNLEDYLESFATRQDLNEATPNEAKAIFLAGIVAKRNDGIINDLLSAMNLK
jgi:hypothetical protein